VGRTKVCLLWDRCFLVWYKFGIFWEINLENWGHVVINPLLSDVELGLGCHKEDTSRSLRGFNLYAPFGVHKDFMD